MTEVKTGGVSFEVFRDMNVDVKRDVNIDVNVPLLPGRFLEGLHECLTVYVSGFLM